MSLKVEGLFSPSGENINCNVCQRRCQIKPGSVGFCGNYLNKGGKIKDLSYGRVSVVQVTELGWAPVKMFADPATRILSVGSLGCNFRCPNCINAGHGLLFHNQNVSPDEILAPETIIEYAKAMDVKGLAANFNEGLLAVAYWRDLFQAAKNRGLFTIAVTNGYSTKEALDLIAQHLDVYRCDIKAVTQMAMDGQVPSGVNPQGVLDSLIYMKKKYPQVQIETVTLVIPEVNDSEEELGAIADWIGKNLGYETPWHLSPFEKPPEEDFLESPPYVRERDLMGGNYVALSSLRFDRQKVSLRLGDSNFDTLPTESYVELESIAEFAKQRGLKNVFVKNDGH